MPPRNRLQQNLLFSPLPKKVLMKRFSCTLSLFIFSCSVLSPASLAGTTDQIIGKVTNAAASMARGDVNGAVAQAVPAVNVPVTRYGNAYVYGNQAGYTQNFTPPGALNIPYVNVGTSYNAHTTVQPGVRPVLANQVQVHTGNQYVSNTTSFRRDL